MRAVGQESKYREWRRPCTPLCHPSRPIHLETDSTISGILCCTTSLRYIYMSPYSKSIKYGDSASRCTHTFQAIHSRTSSHSSQADCPLEEAATFKNFAMSNTSAFVFHALNSRKSDSKTSLNGYYTWEQISHAYETLTRSYIPLNAY